MQIITVFFSAQNLKKKNSIFTKQYSSANTGDEKTINSVGNACSIKNYNSNSNAIKQPDYNYN